MKRLFIVLMLLGTIGMAQTNKSSAPVIGAHEDESSRSMTQVPESLKYLKSLK